MDDLALHQPPDLLSQPMPALRGLLDTLGVGAHHAPRVFRALHRDRQPLDAVPSLGWRRVQRLRDHTRVAAVDVTRHVHSEDGTEKVVFRMGDGARVEGVLIPMSKGRVTLCVSSQVGCAMGCTFCATGTLGLARGLTAGEIIAQVHHARGLVEAQGRQITHLVFMGMGEPLHHYSATRDALRILRDPHGPSYAARHLTVSTVGLVNKMRQFARDFGGRVQLAISLHAGTDATRRRIIPMALRHDMAALKAACLDHPLPGTRALMLEYVVLPGLNDTPAEIDALAQWTQGLRCLVNLIPFNPFPDAEFRAPTAAEVTRVGEQLNARKVAHSIRWPKGRGVAGACGQLAGR